MISILYIVDNIKSFFFINFNWKNVYFRFLFEMGVNIFILFKYVILDRILVYCDYMIYVGGGWLVFWFVGFVFGLVYRGYWFFLGLVIFGCWVCSRKIVFLFCGVKG